jgi:transposase InsO family protein
MADRARERVGLAFIPPGEPWRNGYVESFNSRVRDECLNINIFWSLAQARVVISDWKQDYNHRLPAQLARIPSPSGLRCRLHPPMNDSHQEWISSRGPATAVRLANTNDRPPHRPASA